MNPGGIQAVMKQNNLIEIIEEQTNRALWEVKNVIDCVPEELWNKTYCGMPCWKHITNIPVRINRRTVIRISGRL